MSAEIILPACHHFNAEPATQAPKTSSAFQPCATVKRLTSPQPGESPVPLQKTQSAFMRVYKRNSSLVCRAVAHYGGGSLACQAVASAKAGHFRSLLNSSFCLFLFCTDHRWLAPEAVVAPCCRAAASAKVETRYVNGSLITPANFLIHPSSFLLFRDSATPCDRSAVGQFVFRACSQFSPVTP